MRGSSRSWLFVLVRIPSPACTYRGVISEGLRAKFQEKSSVGFLQTMNKNQTYIINSNDPSRVVLLSPGKAITRSSHCAYTHPSSVGSSSCLSQWLTGSLLSVRLRALLRRDAGRHYDSVDQPRNLVWFEKAHGDPVLAWQRDREIRISIRSQPWPKQLQGPLLSL